MAAAREAGKDKTECNININWEEVFDKLLAFDNAYRNALRDDLKNGNLLFGPKAESMSAELNLQKTPKKLLKKFIGELIAGNPYNLEVIEHIHRKYPPMQDFSCLLPKDYPNFYLLYQIFRGHNDAVNAVAWSPDGRYLASGADDGKVIIWDTITGTGTVIVDTNHEDKEIVRSVAWSPDGIMVASGHCNGKIKIWDTRSKECVKILAGPGAGPQGDGAGEGTVPW